VRLVVAVPVAALLVARLVAALVDAVARLAVPARLAATVFAEPVG
jgi:hypothetical protein